jgi:hypothetical protein
VRDRLVALIVLFRETRADEGPGPRRALARSTPLAEFLRTPHFLTVMALLLIAQFVDRGLSLLILLQVADAMGPPMPTHFDLLVVVTVFSCFGLFGVAFLVWLGWKIHTEDKKHHERGERLTRAVAGLVVQETEKIRELMRD